MTSDATHSIQAAPDPGGLRDVITGTRCLLLGFDGPLCRLFPGHRAGRVADGLLDRLKERGHRAPLTEDERTADGPQAVLRAVARAGGPAAGLAQALERDLAREELDAAATAWPTPYADPLIRTSVAVGLRLALTTDTSPPAVERYLTGRGLAGCFTPHVYARTTDLSRLKPDPHCVDRALAALGAAPGTAVLIGESPADLLAARAAGVRFLGCARDDLRARRLRRAGAEVVVRGLGPVLALVRSGART
ncbi:HAD family hydrolase [Streptomyces albidochromogenes]|uniref:HAD family hydrolase n=1 Tax=Streptomyces albidochromogenes TaxID=329524 RepID=UPI001FCBE682|nr:HAD family hydrolase [Streptomyces albidochromogenes]